MNEFEQLAGLIEAITVHVGTTLTSIWFYVQVMLVGLAALIAVTFSALLRKRTDLVALTMGWPAPLRLVVRAVIDNTGALIFALLTYLMRAVMLTFAEPRNSYFLLVAASLATAWLGINFIAGLIRNRSAVRVVAIAAWTVAALSILGLLDTTVAALDSVSVTVGGLRLSPLMVIKVTVFLLVTLWIATTVSNFLENRINLAADLTPSIQVLIGKIVRLSLIVLAILVVVSSAGIDLSALAIFSGAVGVGIGFGLQKIVSNFVSGIILLADKSIKPGDVVTVGDSYGWVGSMNTRYISVVTRDGREFLIPNEDLVTQRVINWSYSSRQVRLDVNFGVGYGSDPHVVRKLAVEAAVAVPRVLRNPAPVCHIVAFGESSINFVLRFWIEDPIEGLTNVRGGVLLELWDALKREGIEIPYPIRELRLRDPLRVAMASEIGAAAD
jgi:small-conductance mechanosensitive channel